MRKERTPAAEQQTSARGGSASTKRRPGRSRGLACLIGAGVFIAAASIYYLALPPSSEKPTISEKGQRADGAVPASDVSSGPSSAASLPSVSKPDWDELDDPAADGWDTEVFAEDAKKQLKVLGGWLADPGSVDNAEVRAVTVEDFTCWPILPADLAAVFEGDHLRVQRPTREIPVPELGDFHPDRDNPPLRGADGLMEALNLATSPLATAEDVHFKVKIFRVSPSEGEISTRQYFSIWGRTSSGMVEQHAAWDIGWEPAQGTAPPRMRWLNVIDFEQVEARHPQGTLFADCTASVLGSQAVYEKQFLRGMNHWFQRIQDTSRFTLFGNPGLAVGDVNGDGLDDLYVCQEAGLPNRLFLQNPDGTAREASSAWGVDWLESSRSALLIDLDNDADQDLVVAIQGGVVVAENDSEGGFIVRDVLPSSEDTMSLSASDYDGDGLLDIYVCAYNAVNWEEGASRGFVVHDANNGASNTLFRNETSAGGGWRFTDVTATVGLDDRNHRFSLAASWDDFDNDGDQDLYVANDYGRDNLYRNDPGSGGDSGGRRFVDVAEAARVEDCATGMAVTWGDYDRDGWMDVFVGNMWSSAGHRITYQSQFRPGATDQVRRRIQRLARGNTLLRNRGDGTFVDRSAPAHIEMGRWAWGSQFVDLNNDGWEDLVVANGYISAPDTGDL